MLTKTLLSSAAVIMAVAGANAADLPSKKAAPATYVKICDAYGAGFFYIPGTDTCVKLGGYVRAEYQYTPGKDTISASTGAMQQSNQLQSTTGYETRGRIDVDARTPTAMGAARTFIRLRGANTSGVRNETITDKAAYGMSDSATTGLTIESAMVQWAGFTFGVAPENYALMPSFMYNANPFAGFPAGMKQIAYTATFGGGVSATIALEDRKDFGYDQTAFDRVETAANIVGNVRFDQAWGFAAVHAMVGNNSLNDTVTNGAVGTTTFGSYAVGATVSYKLPMLAAGDQIWVGANYTKGMIGSLLSAGGLSNIGTSNDRRLLGGVVRADTNVVQTGGVVGTSATYDSTTGWNLNAVFTHYWAAQWRSNFSAGYVSISPPTSTVASTWGAGKLWEVSGGVIYSPVKDMDIGLEVQYANLKNTMQNPAAAFVTAGSPGLNVNNFTTKLRVERQF